MAKNSNSMHRILDFNHEDPQDVLRRISSQLNRAIEQNFPRTGDNRVLPPRAVSAVMSEDTLVQFIPPKTDGKDLSPANSGRSASPSSEKKSEKIEQPPVSYSDQSNQGPSLAPSHLSKSFGERKKGSMLIKIFWVGAIILSLSAAMSWWLYQFLVAV